MKKPLVSVVMPSYNSEKHIAESIQSIIDQTFTDWEFIIVDGHSKDKTIEIIEGFMAKDSRIKLLYDEGKGIGPALNIGCATARGEYIARMDTDDISLSERLEKEVKYLAKHPKTAMVSCSAQYINDNGDSLGYMFPYTHQHHLKKNITSVLHPGVVMRKSIFDKSGGYPPIKRSEDLMLWYKIIKYGKIKILPIPLVNYRLSGDALSSTMTDVYNREVSKRWKKYAESNVLNESQLEEINHFINDNISNEPNRLYPVRGIENKLLNALNVILPKGIAFRCIFALKNFYGYIK